MAVHGLRIENRVREMWWRRLPEVAAHTICSYECTYCGNCGGQLNFVCSNCGGELVCRPRQKELLVPATSLVLDSIGKKAFVADCPHIDQRAMYAGRQKLLAETCQRRRLCPAKHVGRNRKTQLIDQVF